MSLESQNLDPDAIALVKQIQLAGFTAYLVGGCVRDLLLAGTPKDYDIATSARPEELEKIFGRRCRLIGRRFKLAQVRSGSKIFEVATFRGPPEEQDVADETGFVVRANTYGTAEQDAMSRDFTLNALFYDPVAKELHDYVSGKKDLDARRLRTIGNAETRLREDPVRLLRAVKFASRLGLDIDQSILDVCEATAPLINECPVSRVTEELFRIVETGHAMNAVKLMADTNILQHVIPEIGNSAKDDPAAWSQRLKWLTQVDRMVQAHGVLPRQSLFVLLVWPFVQEIIEISEDAPTKDWGRAAETILHDAAVRMAIPNGYRHYLKTSARTMRGLFHHSKKRRRPGLSAPASLPMALTLLRMGFLMDGSHPQLYETWAKQSELAGLGAAPFLPTADSPTAHKRGPRRPSRRRK